MKIVPGSSMGVVLLTIGSLALADPHRQGEASDKWFDMEHCAWCQPMAADMGMLMDIQWECHLIDQGAMLTTVVPEEHQEQWQQVCEQMKAMEEKLTAGEEMPLCNCCKSHLKLLQAGAKIQEVKTGFGSVTLITSDDAEVVSKIHKHIKRTQREHEKMMAMAQP